MPFAIKATLVAFLGPGGEPSCHFDYHVGDEILYDGSNFTGRVCPGLLGTLMPRLRVMCYSGLAHPEKIIFRYNGPSKRDPGKKKYDGVGWTPTHEKMPEEFTARGWVVECEDPKTIARFRLLPVDLAHGGFFLPYYNRQKSIYQKIKEDPGLTAEDIIKKFTDFERDEIYPELTTRMIEFMLDDMAEVDYVKLEDGKAFITDREVTWKV